MIYSLIFHIVHIIFRSHLKSGKIYGSNSAINELMNWFTYEITSNFCQDQLAILPHRFVRTMMDFFSVLELQKIQLQGGKKYSILLSANEIAERNRLKKQTKTNTVKNCCEKTKKCRVAINWHCMFSAMGN